MKKQFLIFLSVSLFFTSCENKVENSPAEVVPSIDLNFVPAKTNAEFIELTLDKSVNMIRNIDQFDSFVQSEPSIFRKLGQENLRVFRQNLVFKNNGLAGANYAVIKDNLSQANYAQIMATLGIDVIDGFWPGAGLLSSARTSSEDGVNFRCVNKTCIIEPGSLCLSTCQ